MFRVKAIFLALCFFFFLSIGVQPLIAMARYICGKTTPTASRPYLAGNQETIGVEPKPKTA